MSSRRNRKRGPELPEAVDRDSVPYSLGEGRWLVLADIHLPFHDRTTVELAVAQAQKRGVKGVLLNGDLLDFHELSRFDRTPDDPRYPDEIKKGREFLTWLRGKLPRAEVVWKDGNHEERLFTYLCRRAPELFGLDVLTIPNLLEFDKHQITYVTDKRVIRAGKLNIIHGHEYRPTIQAPVNPARGLFLRAKGNAICSHFHQTSEHHEPTIHGKPQGAWSIGCACGLSPLWMPLNKWNHGFAFVELFVLGEFAVRNLRVLNGEVV